MKILFITLLFIFFYPSLVISQTTFTREQLIQDCDSLYCIIRDVHPDMFTVISQEKFENELRDIKSQIKPSMTKIEYYMLVAPLVAALGDGHTSVQFPRSELKNEKVKLFPFSIEIRNADTALLVVNDFYASATEIPSGAKILKINGLKTNFLINQMLNYISGERYFFKTAMLSYLFTPLLYSLYGDNFFEIEYLIDGKTLSSKVEGLSYEQRFQQKKITGTTQQFYSLSIDESRNVAIIDFKSFSNPGQFKIFIDSAFTQIKAKKINDLIIDIRENGGGNSIIGDEFFQYISPVAFQQFGKTTVKVSARQISAYEKNNMQCQKNIGIHTYNDDHKIKLRRNRNRFKGQVYLLTSSYTFSSAADFSWAFKQFKMGTVIGEETGGLAVCFGDVVSQQLPISGLDLGISFKKFYSYGATDADAHGTIPDIDVPSDKAMEKAIEIIMKLRK